MTNPKIRDAQAAVRVLRKRFAAEANAAVQIAVAQALDNIESGLLAAAEEVAAQPAPAAPVEPPPTLSDLERAVIRTALEYHRTRSRLIGFGASARTQTRELMTPGMAFDSAVRALYCAREAAADQRMLQRVGGAS